MVCPSLSTSIARLVFLESISHAWRALFLGSVTAWICITTSAKPLLNSLILSCKSYIFVITPVIFSIYTLNRCLQLILLDTSRIQGHISINFSWFSLHVLIKPVIIFFSVPSSSTGTPPSGPGAGTAAILSFFALLAPSYASSSSLTTLSLFSPVFLSSFSFPVIFFKYVS